MSNCINCGAGLPAGTIVCKYCKTRQDVDLKGVHRHTVVAPEGDRICPRCDVKMETIDLKIEGKFLIERCQSCMGMFFDPGELEAILQKSVSNVFHIDYMQLKALKNAKRHEDFPVVYIKCPVCRKLMHRVNFGAQSGVIIDNCKQDGIWLDGGELRQLMEWTKAGGKLHHQTQEIELQRLKKVEQQNRSEYDVTGSRPGDATKIAQSLQTEYMMGGHLSSSSIRSHDYGDEDLFGLLSRFVSKLFR